MRRIITTLFGVLALYLHLWSQSDSLFVSYSEEYGIYFSQELDAGSTVYREIRKFGADMKAVSAINPGIVFEEMHPEQPFLVPLAAEIIQENPGDMVQPLAVYYRVSKGETMYRIAHTYFQTNLDRLMALNHKPSALLNLGEALLVGWIELAREPTVTDHLPPLTKTSVVTPQKTSEVAVDQNLPTAISTAETVITDSAVIPPPILPSETPEDTSQEMATPLDSVQNKTLRVINSRGIAVWEDDALGGEEMLVIHPTARLYTEITLFNPMMNRRVNALVVGHIPEKTYPDEISVVISREVANALGALDRRFVVDMTYVE